MQAGPVEINAAYVAQRLDEISDDEELSKFIL
jgi:ATP-dependent protease HslVU (ClpYQ) ATPase subunit